VIARREAPWLVLPKLALEALVARCIDDDVALEGLDPGLVVRPAGPRDRAPGLRDGEVGAWCLPRAGQVVGRRRRCLGAAELYGERRDCGGGEDESAGGATAHEPGFVTIATKFAAACFCPPPAR